MNRKIAILCILLLFGVAANSFAQYCPANIDFETGTLANWQYFDGSVSSGPVYHLTPSAPIPGKHTLTMGVDTDAFGGFPIVAPAGHYSLRLGDSITGAEAQRATYNVHVPGGGGIYSLIYHYAVVFEDPLHLPGEQPRMIVKAFDSATGVVIPCDSLCFVASSSILGFKTSPVVRSSATVYYKPWTAATLSFQGYGGRTISVEFTVSDCAPGGHFGYGYIDMGCGLFNSVTAACSIPSVTLFGPAGYMSYRWCDAKTFATTIATTQDVVIPTPGGITKYAVIVTPYPGYGCPDTLFTEVQPKALCGGTPDPGTAYMHRAAACGLADTLVVEGYKLVCGLTYQWQSSTDNKVWTDIPGATNELNPISRPTKSTYFRCLVTCSLTGYSTLSSYVYVPAATGPSLRTLVKSKDKYCKGAHFYVSTCGYSTKFNVTTWYGDGTSDNLMLSADTAHHADFFHNYGFPGRYTVKQVLYDDNTPLDSGTFVHDYAYCSSFPIKIFFDRDMDCMFGSKDQSSFYPLSIEVDSAGIPIDTISSTSGFYYRAYGSPGTVYAFKLVPDKLSYVSCPSSGVIYDTVDILVNDYREKSLGLSCIPGTPFDLFLSPACYIVGRHRESMNFIVGSRSCSPLLPIVQTSFNNKYIYSVKLEPAYGLTIGSSYSWNLPPISTSDKPFFVSVERKSNIDYPIGDTSHVSANVMIITGESDTTNNFLQCIDTVIESNDPNFITVTPPGCLPYTPEPNTLKYIVHFENTGNDTAHNVFVLDTLSPNLDPRSLEIVAASAQMDIASMNVDGYNIVKFDFPGINLQDSAHHGENDGMFVYSIKTRSPLPEGTAIQNRAGIYFDINPVVMTNTVENIIGCPQLSVPTVKSYSKPEIYPNPATTELTIKADNEEYRSFAITDQLGRTLLSGDLKAARTRVDIKALTPGLYYISLQGHDGTTVNKFTKL